MSTALSNMTELFLKNTQSLKEGFPFQSAMLRRMAALIYAGEGREAGYAPIHEARRLIKANTSAFSMFRSTVELGLAAMLSLCSDPERTLLDTLAVYEMLKSSGFYASMQLVFAAFQIAKTVPQDAWQEAVSKTRSAYEAMRRTHPFLSGEQTIVYSALIGSSARSAEEAAEKTEQLFLELRGLLSPKSELLNLCLLLSLSDDSDIASRTMQSYDTLKAEELSFGRYYLLPILGVLVLSNIPSDALAADISQTADTLRAQRGFGGFSVAKQELLLLSASLVAFAQPGSSQPLNTALVGGITGMIVAQQVALAAAAGAAAASSSSSSS